MKHLPLFLVAVLLLAACGQSYEETKRQTREQQKKLWREDSAALKVAVMPTLDCLPFYVAQERGLFERLGVDVRLKTFTAQMDCDTAVERGRVEVAVTDLVRAERLQKLGTPLRYVAATDTYWQLITRRQARLRQLKELDDKMVAMTRYSATDLLTDALVDSAKLKTERVFRIQVNDVLVRLQMLQTNIMDALFMTEPQATVARTAKHRVLMDTRQMDLRLGVVAARERALKNQKRQQQLDLMLKAYNEACDSLNQRGLPAYGDLLEKHCHLKPAMVDSLPKQLKFTHAQAPRQQDVDRAEKWLKGKL